MGCEEENEEDVGKGKGSWSSAKGKVCGGERSVRRGWSAFVWEGERVCQGGVVGMAEGGWAAEIVTGSKER